MKISRVFRRLILSATLRPEGRRRYFLSLAAMIFLICSIATLSHFLRHVAFSSSLLAVAVALATFLGGVAAGITSAIFCLGYVLYSFAEPGKFFVFTPQNGTHATLSCLAILCSATLIGFLQEKLKTAARRNLQAKNKGRHELNHLIQSLPQIVFRTDLKGARTFHSHRWEEYTGNFQAQNWSEWLHPEDLTRSADAWNASLLNFTSHENEVRIRAADGNYRWFVVHANPVLDEFGKPDSWLGTITDIDESKRVREEHLRLLANEQAASLARTGEARLRAIFNSAFDGLVTLDEDGTIFDWNQQAESIFGWSRLEAIGRKFSELVIPEIKREEIATHMQRFLGNADEAPINRALDLEGLRRDGTLFPLQLSMTCLRINSTFVFTAFLADITEQKDHEAAVKERAERLASVISIQQSIARHSMELEKLLDVVARKTESLLKADGCVIELIHGEDLIYRATSDAAAGLTNRRSKRLGSLSGLCMELNHPLRFDTNQDPRLTKGMIQELDEESLIVVPIRRDEVVVGVIKAFAKRQNAFTVPQEGSMQLVAGFLGGAIGLAEAFAEKQQAITSLQESESRLIHAREVAERATRAKSDFLARMSHEIRTPINGVIGMADILLLTPLAEEQKDAARTIYRSAESLLGIVNDILDISKIESGKLELECIPFSLRAQFEEIERVVTLAAKEKGLTFTTEVDPKIHLTRLGDPKRLHQVLSNLLSNSVKFTASGGLELFVTEENKLLRFEVRDTGIGILPENLDKLFLPFSQADNSSSRKFGDTGLGLSIAHHLVSMMGGTIGVKSRQGGGSVFWLVVPMPPSAESVVKLVEASKEAAAHTPAPPKLSAKPEVPRFAQGFRVLVAEDNLVNQKITAKQLQRLGLAYEIVSNGAEAVEAARASRFDLILMDCHMPELDGYEATRMIRDSQDSLLARIPIVALTANALASDIERSAQAGMDDHVNKPVTLENLAAALGKHLRETKLKKTA